MIKAGRSVVFLSQRREEPHNTEVQAAQTTAKMKQEMKQRGSFAWSRAKILNADFCIRLIDQDPFSFLRNRAAALEAVTRAMRIAKEEGATDIGLGSLVASVAHGGLDLVETARLLELRLDHGDDMSTALAVESVWRLRDLGFPLDKATVGVVGAAGIMGAGFARLLAPAVKKLVLVVRTRDKRIEAVGPGLLTQALRASNLEVIVDTDFQALAANGCRLVYTAHSDPWAALRPEHLVPGAIVLDACIPPAVRRADLRSYKHLVLPVGCGVLPFHLAPQGVGVDLGLGQTGPGNSGPGNSGLIAYGCMIGCVLAAYRQEVEDRIGPVLPEYALALLREAGKLGIEPQPFTESTEEIKNFIKTHHL